MSNDRICRRRRGAPGRFEACRNVANTRWIQFDAQSRGRLEAHTLDVAFETGMLVVGMGMSCDQDDRMTSAISATISSIV
ncbi:MAG: hypothetical protein QG608_498 [Actinomycetota bacterium]|nr:hypothetical protein [Actinomycetota bacterium]